MNRIVALWLVGCGAPASAPQDPAPPDGKTQGNVVSASSFVDKTLAGYQAWFAAAGDGSPLDSWYHWGHGTPGPGNVTFELYPDVSDYPAADQIAAPFAHLGNGAPTRLFGSWSDGVIDTHFRWLEDDGIDGVALQRFVVALVDPTHLRQRDEISQKVRDAAERHGRVFYISYDISGADPATWAGTIRADFAANVAPLFASPQYVHQNGRPVLLVWGLGFPDRPGTPDESLALVQWLKGQGVYVVGGVPYNWRTGGGTKPGFDATFQAVDMIQPWAVGTLASDADVDAHFADIVAKDRMLADSRGQDYQRVIWPGFAWSNWNGGTRNMIPRRGGKLFWRQAYQAARTHTSVMIAMLDEYDEGTAIGRAAEDPSQIPQDQYFLTLDADGERVSSDFYLRLAGAANRMLQGAAPVDPTIPIPTNGGTATTVPQQQAATGQTVRTFSDAQAIVVVARLYRTILGREVDPSGSATYAPYVAQGHLPVVVTALITSPEFDAHRGALTIDGFVTAQYQDLLDRAPDSGGAAATAQSITQGLAADRIVDIVVSPEYASKN